MATLQESNQGLSLSIPVDHLRREQGTTLGSLGMGNELISMSNHGERRRKFLSISNNLPYAVEKCPNGGMPLRPNPSPWVP